MPRTLKAILIILLTPIPASLLFLVLTGIGAFIGPMGVIFIMASIYAACLFHMMTIGLLIFYGLERLHLLNFLTGAIGGVITYTGVPALIFIFTIILMPSSDILSGLISFMKIGIVPGIISGLSAWAIWRFLPHNTEAH